MHPPSRLGWKTAALVAALVLVGTSGAQEAGPAAPAAIPQIYKTTVYNGPVATVSYTVQGGSPRLQALCQALQFTENEINLTGELQKLRLGIVVNEQALDRVRTSQQLGLGPISTPASAACYAPPDSALKRALIPGLAQEATPATAYQLIQLREQVQTELQAEQKKAAAAVPGGPPARQNAQAAAPVLTPAAAPQPAAPAAGPAAAPQAVAQQLTMPPVLSPAQTAPQRLPTLLNPQQVFAFEHTVGTAFLLGCSVLLVGVWR
jgi:hypothetical protein